MIEDKFLETMIVRRTNSRRKENKGSTLIQDHNQPIYCRMSHVFKELHAIYFDVSTETSNLAQALVATVSTEYEGENRESETMQIKKLMTNSKVSCKFLNHLVRLHKT